MQFETILLIKNEYLWKRSVLTIDYKLDSIKGDIQNILTYSTFALYLPLI